MRALRQHLPVLPPLQQRMRRPLLAAQQGSGAGIGRHRGEAGWACASVVSRAQRLLMLPQRRGLEAEPMGVHRRVFSRLRALMQVCTHQWEGLQSGPSERLSASETAWWSLRAGWYRRPAADGKQQDMPIAW